MLCRALKQERQMRILIMIEPDHDVDEIMERVKARGVTNIHRIGRLHILLAEMDGRKIRKIAAIPGFSSVEPDREIHLPPHGQPQ